MGFTTAQLLVSEEDRARSSRYSTLMFLLSLLPSASSLYFHRYIPFSTMHTRHGAANRILLFLFLYLQRGTAPHHRSLFKCII